MKSNKHREHERARRNKVMLSIFIVVLMVASVFGIILGNQDQNSFSDHGLLLTLTNTLPPYQATLQGEKQYFYNTPSMVSQVAVDQRIDDLLGNAGYIIYLFDPTEDVSNLQMFDYLRYNLDSYFDVLTVSAITTTSSIYPFPVLDCANATAQTPILHFAVAAEPSIIIEGNCVHFAGNTTRFLETKDALIYNLENILP